MVRASLFLTRHIFCRRKVVFKIPWPKYSDKRNGILGKELLIMEKVKAFSACEALGPKLKVFARASECCTKSEAFTHSRIPTSAIHSREEPLDPEVRQTKLRSHRMEVNDFVKLSSTRAINSTSSRQTTVTVAPSASAADG